MIQPCHPDRSDCPFLISAYAQHKYPLREINKVLNQIQVCSHGWFCEKCCYEYTGKFASKFVGVDTRKVYIYAGGLSSEQHDLTQVIFDSFFDLIGLDNVFVIIQNCGSVRCINYNHWDFTQRIFNKSARSLTITEYLYLYSEVCVHGQSCEKCCWQWHGPFHSRVFIPIIREKQSKLTTVADVIVEQKFGIVLNRTQHQTWSCGHNVCVNPSHVFFKSMTAERQQHLTTLRETMRIKYEAKKKLLAQS